MRTPFLMGNWKMHGSIEFIQQLLALLKKGFKSEAEMVVFPPAIYLPLVADILKETSIAWGAQNVYMKDQGAFTGEISVPMIKDYDTRYVLVGHSERRHIFYESEKMVTEKFHHVKEHDIIPVLCVGETLAEREQGLTSAVLTQQIKAVAEGRAHSFKNCVVAYEPVWAIGTGKTASPEEAQIAHALIRELVSTYSEDDAIDLPIVYGGSVNEKNARALFEMPDVDGGLVGGASLDANIFLEIMTCINYY